MSLIANGAGESAKSFYNGVIGQSLRLSKSSDYKLDRQMITPTSVTGTICTASWWMKKSAHGTVQSFIQCRDNQASGNYNAYWSYDSGFAANDHHAFYNEVDSINVGTNTTVVPYRDPSSWYHVVIRYDSTQGTAANRIRIYKNGTLQNSTFTTTTYPSQNAVNTYWNNVGEHLILFGNGEDSGDSFDGYIAEFNWVDGLSLAPESFGELKNGVWIPVEYTGSYGLNGSRYTFSDSSDIGKDSSGVGNDLDRVSNLSAYDVVPDSPENNFTTLNPLMNYGESSRVVTEGNLKFSDSTNNSSYARIGANLPFEGKWYWEVLIGGTLSSYLFTNGTFDIEDNNNIVSGTTNSTELAGCHGIRENGKYYDNGSLTASYASFSSGDILQVYFDADIGSLFMGRNNTAFNSGSAVATSLPPQEIHCSVAQNDSFSVYNFGQDSSFAGNKTAQGNTDGNGIGDFFYTPPSGFLALCTSNLPEPTIGPNSDDGNSTDFFDTVLYAGNDTDAHVIPASGDDPTSINFTPDWISVKTRSGNDNHSHFWINSSKGANNFIKPDATQAEGTNDATLMKDIGNTENTFRTGAANLINGAGTNHVAWLWRNNGGTKQTLSAGSNASNNTNQVNQTAGISFNNFTTSTRDGSDVVFKHGLGVAPDWVMLKAMESNNYISVYSAAAGGTNLGTLGNDSNSGNVGDDAFYASNGYWGTIDDTNVTFQDNGNVGSSGEEVFAWCFAEKEGFSKFGVYKGNGNADGAFVFTGFRPAFVMIKSTTVAGQYWVIKDTRRDPVNPATRSLYWNVASAEGTGILLDILSNGFKPRTNGNNHNNSGGTYTYMAFAEMPFKYANAR